MSIGKMLARPSQQFLKFSRKASCFSLGCKALSLKQIFLVCGLALVLFVVVSTGRELLAIREWLNAHRAAFPIPPIDPCEVMERSSPLLPRKSNLPKLIHQTWPKDKPIPTHVERWYKKWEELFPDAEHILWSDEDILRLIETDFPWFVATYKWYPFTIMRADASRTFILYKFGGLYADMDYEPLHNFWNRLSDTNPSLIESTWANQFFQNSFMSSPRGHVFWNYTFTVMMERANHRMNEHEREVVVLDTLLLTGPHAIDEAVKRYTKDHPEEQVRILACQNFNRFTIGYQADMTAIADRTNQFYHGSTFKRCGSLLDYRCHLGIHHGTTMWK
jgi:mannosyltransferase OCH1-like enzyme